MFGELIVFAVNQVIKINNKTFTITKIDNTGGIEMLRGTREGDPSFLAGKRSVVARELIGKNGKFKYTW
jgi:hypothetical protein